LFGWVWSLSLAVVEPVPGACANPHWVADGAACLGPMGVDSPRDVPLSVGPPAQLPRPRAVFAKPLPVDLPVDGIAHGPGRLADAALQGAALALHRGRSPAGQIHRGELLGGLLPGRIHRRGLGETHGHSAPGRVDQPERRSKDSKAPRHFGGRRGGRSHHPGGDR